MLGQDKEQLKMSFVGKGCYFVSMHLQWYPPFERTETSDAGKWKNCNTFLSFCLPVLTQIRAEGDASFLCTILDAMIFQRNGHPSKHKNMYAYVQLCVLRGVFVFVFLRTLCFVAWIYILFYFLAFEQACSYCVDCKALWSKQCLWVYLILIYFPVKT